MFLVLSRIFHLTECVFYFLRPILHSDSILMFSILYVLSSIATVLCFLFVICSVWLCILYFQVIFTQFEILRVEVMARKIFEDSSRSYGSLKTSGHLESRSYGSKDW